MTDAVGYPVLAEPVPIELANTRYRDGEEIVDFLAPPFSATDWFDSSPTASLLIRPMRWSAADRAELVRLRDVVDVLLRASISNVTPRAADTDALNRAAARTSSHPMLEWDVAPRRVERRAHRSRLDAVLGVIAADTIELLTGAAADAVRICANDDCQLLFVRNHHRRRWCHNSCGHRHRQAAYSRRIHQRDVSNEFPALRQRRAGLPERTPS